MKLLGMAIIVFVFVGMPLYALNRLVLPAITQLQATYTHADETADNIVGMPSPSR